MIHGSMASVGVRQGQMVGTQAGEWGGVDGGSLIRAEVSWKKRWAAQEASPYLASGVGMKFWKERLSLCFLEKLPIKMRRG